MSLVFTVGTLCRMYRLVKEEGMELGVLITKKFNRDKRTTGYIIAYIEPHGLVHRCSTLFI
jgi:hypothetical protein